jgi:micrococcal nuclease
VFGKRCYGARILLAFAFLLFSSCALSQTTPQREAEYRTVTRVVDGDTVVLENGERVRLIGVDTPENKDPQKPVEYFSQEATEFTKRIVEGKK